MKKKFIYLIVVITLINLTALGTILYQRWLNPNASPCEPIRESRFEHVKQELALTSSQIERFEEVRHNFHSRIDSLNRTLEKINHQLLQEIWEPQPRDAHIDSLMHEVSRIQLESQRLVISHFYQFKEVLTPEQWKKFYGIVAERFPGRLRNFGSRQQTHSEKDKQ